MGYLSQIAARLSAVTSEGSFRATPAPDPAARGASAFGDPFDAVAEMPVAEQQPAPTPNPGPAAMPPPDFAQQRPEAKATMPTRRETLDDLGLGKNRRPQPDPATGQPAAMKAPASLPGDTLADAPSFHLAEKTPSRTYQPNPAPPPVGSLLFGEKERIWPARGSQQPPAAATPLLHNNSGEERPATLVYPKKTKADGMELDGRPPFTEGKKEGKAEQAAPLRPADSEGRAPAYLPKAQQKPVQQKGLVIGKMKVEVLPLAVTTVNTVARPTAQRPTGGHAAGGSGSSLGLKLRFGLGQL